MPTIFQLPTQVPGLVDVFPNQKFAVFGDNLATITTAGYLNSVNLESNPISKTDILQVLYSFDNVSKVGTYGVFTVSISNSGVITLNSWANPGDVLLPVVNNDFANFNGTTGQIKDSGYSPSDATKTKVVMAGSAVVVNNIAHFTDVAGTVDDTAAAVTNMGDIYAGASGTAGALRSYPATATTGYLGVTGVANAGNFAVNLSNVSHGQATVHSLPDPANAISRVLVGATATPFVSGNFPVASGTGGLMVDSGVAAAGLQQSANIKAARTANIGGGGAGPISVVVAGLTAASIVTGSIQASSNPVEIQKVTATATGFDILFSGDPGATCTVNYIAFVAAQ